MSATTQISMQPKTNKIGFSIWFKCLLYYRWCIQIKCFSMDSV